ncbi:type II toxin-antitoxin system YoeB family toxin [Sphingomonas faeni]|uniref:type II toxin-antitoxin system YoeB family toxin n=1 Tax=Sphingomonas faeni TaxID=185950 RepID=UPI0027805976|nr:type II toxin-antitoxin system YoeB family toxin [Sphingomonas faeni]MDQ0838896.1 hypothetical protein [Sphingomonas faeni]
MTDTLIEECRRNPFKGTGKPDPLGGNLSGWWSRRINHEEAVTRRRCRLRSAGITIDALVACPAKA